MAIKFEVPNELVLVSGDRTRLIQVHVNLIHNAAKYSETKTPIRVRLECSNEQIHVTVADDGRGIPPEKLESIFEPFAQLEESRTKSDGGLGVGLTLAKSLVELHGGTIVAESCGRGRGSVFHIWLPRLTSEQLSPSGVGFNAQLIEQREQGKSTTPASSSTPDSLRICIVEDMDDSREMVKALLELDGHQVAAVANGKLAVELLKANGFDLALVDIGLPDMSGYDVARQVHASHPVSKPKIIALTGYGQPADVQEALDAGFDDHMVKPIDTQTLHELCASIVRSDRSRQQDDAQKTGGSG